MQGIESIKTSSMDIGSDIHNLGPQSRYVCSAALTINGTEYRHTNLSTLIRSLQTSGNEIFYRNPYDVNECLFVNMSSPSSSKYTSLKIIG